MADRPHLDPGMRGQRADDRGAAVLADQQFGVIARRQLMALGFSASAIDRRLAAARLWPVRRGVYSLGSRSLPDLGPTMAVALTCGPGAVLSHSSAAYLWGLTKARPTLFHVTKPVGRRSSGRGITMHEAGCLAGADVTKHRGIPVTSIPRTLLDLAATEPWRLTKAIDEAERRRVFDLCDVQDLIDRSSNCAGVARLRASLAAYVEPPPFTRSGGERALVRLCRSAGLPEPACNLNIAGHEVDALWGERRLIVELDSWGYHCTRADRERDLRRDVELGIAGYTVRRVSGGMLAHQPEQVVRLLLRLLRE